MKGQLRNVMGGYLTTKQQWEILDLVNQRNPMNHPNQIQESMNQSRVNQINGMINDLDESDGVRYSLIGELTEFNPDVNVFWFDHNVTLSLHSLHNRLTELDN